MTKMPFITSSYLVRLCCILFLAFQNPTTARDLPSKNVKCAPVSTILVFGDSTGDPGNNNNLFTAYKSNFYPYGKDFADHKATGRFSNGLIMTDYIAKDLGIKDTVPPALDVLLPTDALKSGVSFASAASGYDLTTSTLNNVISMTEQLIMFHAYKARMMLSIGVDETNKLIDNALFIVSAGTNDYILNYPIQKTFNTFSAYNKFLIKETRKVLQTLVDQGARHIGVVGLPPIGCLPFVITLYSPDAIHNRDCIANFSSAAKEYNEMLKDELENCMKLQSKSSGARIAYLDSYKPLEGMVSGKTHCFDKVNVGCCGTGMLEAGYFCNPLSPVCDDADKYLFWDSVHPTDKAYSILSKSFMPAINKLYKN